MYNSIKLKLILWFLLVFSIISIGFDIYIYEEQKVASMASVDRFLQNKSHFFAGLIEVYKNGSIEFEPAEKKAGFERRATLYDIARSGHYYRVFFEDGSPLAVSSSLEDYPLPISIEKALNESKYFETVIGPEGEPLRILTEKITIKVPYAEQKEYTFILQVAESLEEAYSFLKSLKKLILYSIPITILLSGLGGLLIAGLSLRPLKKFSNEVGKISESSLDKRLHEDKVSKELKELARAFNATLDNLEKSFNQQKRFISDASHELRTPSAIIKSYCEVQMRKDRDIDEYKKALQVILNNTKKMEGLIEKLLVLSRLEQKRLPMKKERFALSGIIYNTRVMLTPLAETRNVSIRVIPSVEEVYIEGDKTYISEVLTNIVDNAIKYNTNKGIVEISIHENTDEIIIEVEDTGIGISKDEISNIFQRFYRINTSRAKDFMPDSNNMRGSGLGLSIAKEIVENHQGRIDVKSKLGVGSIFSIHLPKAI